MPTIMSTDKMNTGNMGQRLSMYHIERRLSATGVKLLEVSMVIGVYLYLITGFKYPYAMSAMKFIATNMPVKSRTVLVRVGKSLSQTALMVSCPIPGHAKIRSMTTAPVTNPANVIADVVNGCRTALRNACFHMTVLCPAPLARAIFTYSESSTSSIDDRVNRRKAADGPQPSANAGIIKYLIFVQLKKDTLSGPAVPTGNQSRFTANSNMPMIPTQNTGAACPTSAIVRLM